MFDEAHLLSVWTNNSHFFVTYSTLKINGKQNDNSVSFISVFLNKQLHEMCKIWQISNKALTLAFVARAGNLKGSLFVKINLNIIFIYLLDLTALLIEITPLGLWFFKTKTNKQSKNKLVP